MPNYSLIQPFDVAPFLSPRTTTPYTPPKATDYSGVAAALMDIGNSIGDRRRQEEQDQLKREQLAQQGALDARRLDLVQRGQDLTERERSETNTRMDREKAEAHINALTAAYTQAQATGDVATTTAIQQELQRSGYSMKEYESNAPQEAPPPAAAPSDVSRGTNDLESGGNPAARNPTTGASGLFQLMPDQARAMGYTPEQVRAMSPEDQRTKLYPEYLKRHGLTPDQVRDPGENYLAITAPSFAGKGSSDDTPVYRKGTPEYDTGDNGKAWDTNKDGVVTVGELRKLGRGGAGSSVLGGGSPAPKSDITLPDQDIGPPEGSTGAAVKPELRGQLATKPGGGASIQDFMQSEYGIPPRPAADVEKPGGGRFVFFDKGGNKAFEYDRPKIQREQAAAAEAGLSALIDSASTPEQKAAAQGAVRMARAMAGQGRTIKEAQDAGMKFYQSQVGEAGKTERAGIVADAAGTKATAEAGRNATNDVSRDFKLPALNQAEADAKQALAMLDENSGLGDVLSMRKMLRSVEQARTSDADYRSVVGATGWLDKALGMLDKIQTGQLPPDLRENLRSSLATTLKNIQDQKERAAMAARSRIEGGLLGTPSQKGQLSANVGPSLGMDAAPPPKRMVDMSDEELIRKALGQ